MRNRRRIFIALTLFSIGACGPPPMPTLEFPGNCSLLPPSSGRADTVTVALFDTVEPEYAPWGHNLSERLAFAQLYETLVTVDCQGEVHPALAASWKRSRDGRRWTFTLRNGARFTDGTRVRAADVVASWADALTLETGIDSVVASANDGLAVYFAQPQRRVPLALAAPAFAVTAPHSRAGWPLGTGPYEIARDRGHASEFIVRPAYGTKGPLVRFVNAPAADARDLLGGGADLMITGDPTVVEYAMGQPQLSTVALPWETAYVLLAVSRIRSLGHGESPPSVPASLSESLARDAVHTDARACTAPFWWDELDACGAPLQTTPLVPGDAEQPGARRILYDDDDPVARDLANRIAALSAPNTSSDAAAVAAAVPGFTAAGLSARGVRPGELAKSMRDGADFAYVVALPRETSLPCHQARELIRRAPWLSGLDGGLSHALLPLVDTRPYAIATDCGIDLVADRYGGVRIVDAGSSGK